MAVASGRDVKHHKLAGGRGCRNGGGYGGNDLEMQQGESGIDYFQVIYEFISCGQL